MDKPTATKTCSRCSETLPLDQFSRANWCADGHRGQCKACRRTPTHPKLAAPEKTCTGCGVTKPIDLFQRRTQSPDGFYQRCKSCRRIEKAAEYDRNRKTINAQNNAWYWANRDRSLEAVKAWQLLNADRRRDTENRRRARKRNSFVAPVDLDALWTGICPLCDELIDRDLSGPHPLSKSIDHIIPLARGGSHEQSNLQWTHLRCNVRKGARLTD